MAAARIRFSGIGGQDLPYEVFIPCLYNDNHIFMGVNYFVESDEATGLYTSYSALTTHGGLVYQFSDAKTAVLMKLKFG